MQEGGDRRKLSASGRTKRKTEPVACDISHQIISPRRHEEMLFGVIPSVTEESIKKGYCEARGRRETNRKSAIWPCHARGGKSSIANRQCKESPCFSCSGVLNSHLERRASRRDNLGNDEMAETGCLLLPDDGIIRAFGGSKGWVTRPKNSKGLQCENSSLLTP